MIEKSTVGMRRMYIHIQGCHTLCFITVMSVTVTWWLTWRFGWRQSSRWRCRRFWWRCGGSFGPPACLLILCCAILTHKAAVCLIFVNHCRVSFYCSLHHLTTRKLNSLPLLFSEFGVRYLFSSWVSTIAACENSALDIWAIVKARQMSDCSSCTRPPCLDIMADKLKPYKILVVVSKWKIRLLPNSYTTL